MQEVAYTLDGGGTVTVETADQPQGRQPASRGGGPTTAQKTFQEALAGVKPIAEAIRNQVVAAGSDSVEVQFGIKLATEAGVVVASSKGEAHCQVTLTWHKGRDSQA